MAFSRAALLGVLVGASSLVTASAFAPSSSFVTRSSNVNVVAKNSRNVVSGGGGRSSLELRMGLDIVTYLRTEFISAALVTNQTPKSADVCLQLGTEDGRAVTFIPRTINELMTSSAEADGTLSVATRRQLKQQAERRTGAAKVSYMDQRCDDLKLVKDESVDVVISMQAAAKMMENGQDWKRGVREAARVLKPGGRFLFVEQTTLGGESYLDYVDTLYTMTDEEPEAPKEGEEEKERFPIFEEVGYDDVDKVFTAHVAGVAVKSMDAGMTPEERMVKQVEDEKERMAELSISAFERGAKKRRKKRKKRTTEEMAEEAQA
eukprot:scaffold2032_cov44-Attheya_sp.AAC.2